MSRTFLPQPFQKHKMFLVILGLYLLTALLWSSLIPPFEKPDEIHHFAYVQFIAYNAKIPNLLIDQSSFVGFEAQQPPLFYFITGIVYRLVKELGLPTTNLDLWAHRINPNFYWNSQSSVKETNFFYHSENLLDPTSGYPYDLLFLRLFSIFLGGLILLYTYKASYIAFRKEAPYAILSTSFLAFLPQFSFIVSSVSNDILVILFGTIFISMIVRIVSNPEIFSTTQFMLLGVISGLGILSKLIFVSFIPICILLILIIEEQKASVRIRCLVVYSVSLLLVCGWWFVRNYWLYGDLLGTHWKLFPEKFAWEIKPKSLFSSYFSPNNYWRLVGESFVGKFGFMHIDLPGFIYKIWLALFFVSTLGIGLQFLNRKYSVINIRIQILLISSIILALIQSVLFNLMISQPQGRYFFHLITAISIVFTSGLVVIFKFLRSRTSQTIVINLEKSFRISSVLLTVVVCTLAIVNIMIILVVVAPLYT